MIKKLVWFAVCIPQLANHTKLFFYRLYNKVLHLPLLRVSPPADKRLAAA